MSKMGSKKNCKDFVKTIQEVFYDSQFTKKHGHLIKSLKVTYKQSVLEEFLAEYLKCLKICFLNPEKCSNVEHALDFAAKFAVSLSENLDEDETCPFLSGVFEFLFENHECDDHLVRFHVCHFINRLLDNMPHDASLEDEVFNKISKCMMERLQDKMASVRAEAVFALHRLQTPGDPNCSIISVFMYHLTCDPSYEVRSAIVQKIAINKKSLPVVLRRINDVKDVVRKETYKQLHNLSVLRFAIRQRQTILERGLNDKFEMVRLFVTNTLIPSWLKAFNDNYLEFVKAINVESLPKVTISVLQAIFKQQQAVTLPSLMRQMNIVDKVVPLSKLCSETVVFWRAMAEYLKPQLGKEEDKDEYFEIVLPDLTPFTQYIQQFFLSLRTSDLENSGDFILCQLLQMAKIYDLSDEMGRGCLKQLCIDLLQSSQISLEATTIASEVLNSVIPEPNTRLTVMAEIISELREPLCSTNTCESEMDVLASDGRSTKNDPETLMKCLTIAISIFEAQDIVELNPTLHSLVQNFILPTLELPINDIGKVHSLCLQALGQLCVLDLELAKEQLLIFCFKMADTDLCLTALKVVFDLLLKHGLDAFSIEEPKGDFKTDIESPEKRKNLIFLLVSLLDSQSSEMCRITMQGLCKLIYATHLCNPYLIARLILLWFDPELENDAHLKQPLAIFFSMFASNCPHAPNLLLTSFLPTLKICLSNYDDTKYAVNIDQVCSLIINMTRKNVNKYHKNADIHNKLALLICKEILDKTDFNVGVLIKALLQLELNFTNSEEIDTIFINTEQLITLFDKDDKANQRLLVKFKLMLEVGRNHNNSISTVQNTLPEDATFSTPSTSKTATTTTEDIDSTFKLSVVDNENTDNEDDGDNELYNELLQVFPSNVLQTPGPSTSKRDKEIRVSSVTTLSPIESPSSHSTKSSKGNSIANTLSSDDVVSDSSTKIKNERSRKRVKVPTTDKTPVTRRTTRRSETPEQEPSLLQLKAEKKLEEEISNDQVIKFKTPGPLARKGRKLSKEIKDVKDESKTYEESKKDLTRTDEDRGCSSETPSRPVRATRSNRQSDLLQTPTDTKKVVTRGTPSSLKRKK